MVESTANPLAEAKKAEGNQAFKARNYQQAITLFTEALNIEPSEQILSNRAAAYILENQFRLAVQDCQAGIRINN